MQIDVVKQSTEAVSQSVCGVWEVPRSMVLRDRQIQWLDVASRFGVSYNAWVVELIAGSWFDV